MHPSKIEKLAVGAEYELEGEDGAETSIHFDYITYRRQEYALACGTGERKDCLFAFTVSVEDNSECFDFIDDEAIEGRLGKWYLAQYGEGANARSITTPPTPLNGKGQRFRLATDNTSAIVDYVGDVEIDCRYFSFFFWKRPLDKMEPQELMLVTIFIAEHSMSGGREVWEPVDEADVAAALEELRKLDDADSIPNEVGA